MPQGCRFRAVRCRWLSGRVSLKLRAGVAQRPIFAINMQMPEFTQQQTIAISLIQADLRFLFTVINNSVRFKSNYIISLMPYMGVIIHGVENWIQAYNNSSKQKINVPTFNGQEIQNMMNYIKG